MEAFAYFSTFRPGCQEPVQNAFPVLSCLCYFLPFPAISCGSCYFLRCPPISGEFVLFTAVFLGLKCVLKIISKSIPNRPKNRSKICQRSTPNWSKITQKSSQNRSKMAPWRGSRFLMIFHHILDPFLDPFWISFRSKNDLKNISKITCKNVSKKVRLWTFQVSLLGSIFAPSAMYFPNAFQASILSVRFTCFLHFSNRWTLKKHCISAVKHVFQQVQHF